MSTVVVGQLLKSCKVARHSADWLRSPAPFLWSISLTGTVWWKSVRWRKHWRQDSRECQSKALWKKYVLSLDLNLDSESQRIIVSSNEFQTVGAEQRKARFAKSVLVNGLSSSGAVEKQSVRSLTRALMWRLRYVGAVAHYKRDSVHYYQTSSLIFQCKQVSRSVSSVSVRISNECQLN